MKKSIERPFELKSIADTGKFTGYGSVFGERDSYRDIVMPGAFTKSLADDFASKGRKVPMLWQHRSGSPIGIYTDIKEDAHGLYVEGEINMEVQQGKEAHALMKQGALSGLSIGYETITEEWDKDDRVRKLHAVKLWEISPVTFPAGDTARIQSVKSFDELVTLSDCEKFLRDAADLSQKEAATLIARIKAASQGDPDASHQDVSRALQALQAISFR